MPRNGAVFRVSSFIVPGLTLVFSDMPTGTAYVGYKVSDFLLSGLLSLLSRAVMQKI